MDEANIDFNQLPVATSVHRKQDTDMSGDILSYTCSTSVLNGFNE